MAGELGGRFIEAPRGHRARPTSERVRESWFSALGEQVRGARVLDLFAGSGALGIEALSRGAARVQFVEADRRVASVLQRNVAALGIGPRARVTKADAFAFLRTSPTDRFDLALADPPYRGDAARRLAERFHAKPFARLLCVEHPPGALDGVEGVVWRRRYGDTELTFLAADRAGGGGETAAPGQEEAGA